MESLSLLAILLVSVIVSSAVLLTSTHLSSLILCCLPRNIGCLQSERLILIESGVSLEFWLSLNDGVELRIVNSLGSHLGLHLALSEGFKNGLVSLISQRMVSASSL